MLTKEILGSRMFRLGMLKIQVVAGLSVEALFGISGGVVDISFTGVSLAGCSANELEGPRQQ